MNKNYFDSLTDFINRLNNKKTDYVLTDGNNHKVGVLNSIRIDMLSDKCYLICCYDDDCSVYFLDYVTEAEDDGNILTFRCSHGDEYKISVLAA